MHTQAAILFHPVIVEVNQDGFPAKQTGPCANAVFREA